MVPENDLKQISTSIAELKEMLVPGIAWVSRSQAAEMLNLSPSGFDKIVIRGRIDKNGVRRYPKKDGTKYCTKSIVAIKYGNEKT